MLILAPESALASPKYVPNVSIFNKNLIQVNLLIEIYQGDLRCLKSAKDSWESLSIYLRSQVANVNMLKR